MPQQLFTRYFWQLPVAAADAQTAAADT